MHKYVRIRILFATTLSQGYLFIFYILVFYCFIPVLPLPSIFLNGFKILESHTHARTLALTYSWTQSLINQEFRVGSTAALHPGTPDTTSQGRCSVLHRIFTNWIPVVCSSIDEHYCDFLSLSLFVCVWMCVCAYICIYLYMCARACMYVLSTYLRTCARLSVLAGTQSTACEKPPSLIIQKGKPPSLGGHIKPLTENGWSRGYLSWRNS